MPKQTKSQAIGHEGERWFASQLPATWIPQFPTWDVGVDSLVVICEDGPLNGLEFRVQVKSSEKWQIQNDSILVKGFRRAALFDLVHGFTPALLVLYESSSATGYCYWVNQIVGKDTELLSPRRNTVTFSVPMTRQISPGLWPKLGGEVGGLMAALGRRVAISGISIPILEATHSLMQSLHLIHLCANGKGGTLPQNELLNAEVTAHKEIVTTLMALDAQLQELDSPIVGIREVAERYVATCARFILEFSDYVKHSGAGFVFQVCPSELVEHRPEAIRAVTQVVSKLTLLSLQSARAVGKADG